MPPGRLWDFHLSRGKFSGTAFISLGPRSMYLACGVAADGASEIFISPLGRFMLLQINDYPRRL